MTENQKNRIDLMTRDELQNILLESELYDLEIVDYVKSKIRSSAADNHQKYAAAANIKPNFSSSYISFFNRYADFRGRSCRSEYWYMYLANIIVTLIAYILLIPNIITLAITQEVSQLAELLIVGGAFFIYQIICVIPNLALSVRRLHDIGKSGWNILLGAIPLIGAVILFIYTLTDSEENDNKYGKNPKRTPNEIHCKKNNTVLIVLISFLIGSIGLSVWRSYVTVHQHNEMVQNGYFDDYDYSSDANEDYDYNFDSYDDYSYDSYGDNYYQLYPTDTEYITYHELNSLTREEIALIRNEIYARHGYIFKKEPYKSYFNEMPWYTPNPNFSEDMLSQIEKDNRNTIEQFERDMGWK